MWRSLLTLVGVGCLATLAHATTFIDNLGDSTAGTRLADSTEWLTAGFSTNANTYDALKVTILANQSSPGLLRMELWSDSLGHPGFFIDGLDPITSISGSLEEVSYAGTNLNLESTESYYIVMKPLAGEYNWAYTEDSEASWGYTVNFGVPWAMSTFNPLQFKATGLNALDGDANLDGTVNFPDLLVVAQNYGRQTEVTWPTGDFDNDGGCTFDDLLLVAQNYGDSVPTFEQDWLTAQSIASSTIPEPASLGLLMLVLPMLRRR